MSLANESARSGLFDRLGIGVSMTCAVHCVLTSLVALAPALGLAGPDALGLGTAMEWLELPLLAFALCIGLWALVPGYTRDHRQPHAIMTFVVGITLVAASRLVVSPGETSGLETGLTVVGVAFIASAHVLNLRAHAAHHRAHEHGPGGEHRAHAH